jgi:acetyl esterase/lipase
MPAVAVAALAAVALAGAGAAGAVQAAGGGKGRPHASTYAYGPAAGDNTLDVYSPTSAVARRATSLPAVVLVHGGSWIRGDRTDLAGPAVQFARAGYVAVSVNYRLATRAAWPAQRDDVRAALEWVRAHARSLRVDTSRIVVVGSSAGGEIAASALTLGHGSDLARGLVTLSSPLDLGIVAAGGPAGTSAAELAAVVNDDLLACRPADCADRYRTASAASALDARDVPLLLITSLGEWVDPASTIGFHTAATAAGLESRLVLLPGTAHAQGYWADAWPTISDWVAAHTA